MEIGRAALVVDQADAGALEVAAAGLVRHFLGEDAGAGEDQRRACDAELVDYELEAAGFAVRSIKHQAEMRFLPQATEHIVPFLK